MNSEDLKKLPSTDLYTIDQLWLKSSKGRFGFSVQKEIWLSVGDVSNPSKESNYKIYKKFGERVGWYVKEKDKWLWWEDLTFSLNAPVGHLPVGISHKGERMLLMLDGVVFLSSLWQRLLTCEM